MDEYLKAVMKYLEKDMTSMVAIGAGLLLTAYVTVSYFRKKQKELRRNDSDQRVFEDAEAEKKVVLPYDGYHAHLKREAELVESLKNEKEKKEQAENRCEIMAAEVRAHQEARRIAEDKYNKLMQRYNVVSKKLKTAEQRCKSLIDAMDDEDEELDNPELLQLVDEDYDEDDEDEDDENDDEDDAGDNDNDVAEYGKHVAAPHAISPHDSSDFELGQDIMQALVATAVGDINDFRLSGLIPSGCDLEDDSLSDILADNMDEDDQGLFLPDLGDQARDREGHDDDDDAHSHHEEENDVIISDHLQDVKSSRQFWEHHLMKEQEDWSSCSRRSESTDSSEHQRLSPEIERSSPFQDLRKQWSKDLPSAPEARVVSPSRHEGQDREESSDRLEQDNVDDNQSPDFKSLKRQWEEKMANSLDDVRKTKEESEVDGDSNDSNNYEYDYDDENEEEEVVEEEVVMVAEEEEKDEVKEEEKDEHEEEEMVEEEEEANEVKEEEEEKQEEEEQEQKEEEEMKQEDAKKDQVKAEVAEDINIDRIADNDIHVKNLNPIAIHGNALERDCLKDNSLEALRKPDIQQDEMPNDNTENKDSEPVNTNVAVDIYLSNEREACCDSIDGSKNPYEVDGKNVAGTNEQRLTDDEATSELIGASIHKAESVKGVITQVNRLNNVEDENPNIAS